MEKRIPLFYLDIPIGFLVLTQQGSRTIFAAECSWFESGVLRAYAYSKNNPGVRLLIGVMMPEGAVLKAVKVYTRDELMRLKIFTEQIDAAEIVADEHRNNERKDGWVKCMFPQRFFKDYALRSSLSGVSEILCDKEHEPTCVAARIGIGAFPLAPAFCLVRVIKIGGELYGVLGRSGKGVPVEVERRSIPQD